MANYNLVISTENFKPFDISPALQVLHDYRDAYQRLEEQLNKIAEEKGQYILPDTPETAKYKGVMDRYNSDYASVVDDFSKGMNLNNRAAVMNIRKRYQDEVAPINRAAESYNKYQDKLAALGPDAIIGNPRTFEDFYGGVNPQLEYRSAKDIQRTAAGIMQGLDNALMNAPEQAGSIAKQYFVLRQQGLDGSQALSTIMQHNPMSQQTAQDASQLIQALDNVYNTYSKDTFSQDAKQKIWENTMLGAIQGIQAPKYTMQHNMGYLNPAQSYNLSQSQKEDKFKYKYDEKTGAIVGYSDEYLKGVGSTGRGGKTPKVTERVPDGGTFHPTGSKKEQDIASSDKISRDNVPPHIRSQYPDDSEFLVCRDSKGNIIGYMGIKYKDRTVIPTEQNSEVSVVDESEGEE